MAQLRIDEAVLRALQRRAEALARGEIGELGQAINAAPAVEDLRRAIEVLGAHTTQGLQHQHAYIAALSTAQEAERGRIARELHDDAVQQLIVLAQGVDRIQRLLERADIASARERLHTMRGNITALVDALRTVISDLRPPALEELGLLPAVELLLQRGDVGGPTIALHVQGSARRLAPQSELALFRIIQEAWSNIRRHAHADHADVTFRYGADRLAVTITDDGVGFAPSPAAAPAGHWGVRGMRERAELAGGALEVVSTPGQGTRLTIAIPYPGVDDRDPVCGMSVGPDAVGATHNEQIYRFCSPACRDLFLAQPQQYVAPM
jgi:signal transduction histidine kinase/YHS domain-containing protein